MDIIIKVFVNNIKIPCLCATKHVPYPDREPHTPLTDQTWLLTHDANMTAKIQETN